MNRDKQRELLSKAIIGDLPPDEASLLLAECRKDPALLDEFSKLTIVERLLAHGHLYPDDGAFVREVRARLNASPSPPILLPVRQNWFQLSWKWAAAAVLALLATVSWIVRPQPAAATIVKIESVTWASNTLPLRPGDNLKATRLQFENGLMELQFRHGATAIIEGPTDFEIRAPNHMFVHRGRVVTRVSKEARGFILDSPRGILTDLGTEFGVNVLDSGDTEVHVLEGSVEAKTANQIKPLLVSEKQAIRLTQQKIEHFAAEAVEFITDLPPLHEANASCLHWSFDEGEGLVSTNRGFGIGAPDARALLGSFPSGGTGPQWIPGQFGSGLYFDGKDDFVECDFAGIPGGQPRTVAFWVKVPRNWQTNEGYGIINWGTLGRPGMAWQISINPEAADGPLGRLRLGVHGGWVVGTSDLRDDRWHHCAVVMYGGHRPDSGTHILLYVDGDLEPAALKAVQEIRTQTEGKLAHNMWLGRNLSYLQSGSRITGGRFFRGCLDELYIFNAALDQVQLQSLMKYNRLPIRSNKIAQR